MLGPVCLGCVWLDLGTYSIKSGGALFRDVVLNLFGAYVLEIEPGWGSFQPGNRLWEREFLCQKLNDYVCIYYEQVRHFIGLQLKFNRMYLASCLVTLPPRCAYPQLCELIFILWQHELVWKRILRFTIFCVKQHHDHFLLLSFSHISENGVCLVFDTLFSL